MSGMNGEAKITKDQGVVKATALVNTAQTDALLLDTTQQYAVFLAVSGPTDVTLQATLDSHEAILNGTAIYTAAKGKTNNTAGGLLAMLDKGVTGLKVVQTKYGAGTDDATTVAALGGRSCVRCVPVVNADGGTGLTDYTPITLT